MDSDEELIHRFLGGDMMAFEQLYSKYKSPLYSFLYNMLEGKKELADDIFQQTWLKIISKLPSYRDECKFLPWAMRISRNLAMDFFRKSKKEVLLDFSDPVNSEIQAVSERPWKEMDRKEIASALGKCLSKLPIEQRETFVLRQDEISFKEIAEMQGASINTVLARMRYALLNLRDCLSRSAL